ncbi:MAG: histone deacetylase family protein [Gammaproteobacteria bacterium]
MTIAFFSHPACERHETLRLHPEQPARLSAIADQLLASGLDFVIRYHEAPPADRAQLLRVHTAEYIDQVFNSAPKEGLTWLDGDTAMGPLTLDAALHAAGAVIGAVDLVLDGPITTAFCAVRPPGHHAERARTGGFCIFNNVAVGAAHALAVHGLERIAIVDFDVHHGNGTEDVFRDEARVLFCSSFQHPFYPNTGADTVSDHIVNVPLKAGARSAGFREAIEQRWFPALEAFRPQLLMISAGFDGHIEEDMAQLGLIERDYAWVTKHLKDIADRHAQGRIVSVLEGGYTLGALGRSVAAHLNALLGTAGTVG